MNLNVKREPALVLALVQAVIALAVSFGLQLTPEQVGAILAVTAAVAALLVRSQVTPGGADVAAGEEATVPVGPTDR